MKPLVVLVMVACWVHPIRLLPVAVVATEEWLLMVQRTCLLLEVVARTVTLGIVVHKALTRVAVARMVVKAVEEACHRKKKIKPPNPSLMLTPLQMKQKMLLKQVEKVPSQIL